jgi:cytochrome c-type biogenesis protein CcmE
VARKRSPARLVIALGVAAVLAVFLLYTSIAGGTNASLRPSQLGGHANEKVQLAGLVVGPVSGDPYEGGMRFRLRDIDGKATVAVVYTGSKPDLFRVGRHVYLKGRLANGTFVGERNSLVTKCPSKYVPKKNSD